MIVGGIVLVVFVSIRCRARRTAERGLFVRLLKNRLFPIEGVGPDFAVVGASVRG